MRMPVFSSVSGSTKGAPSAPTIGTATAGNANASVTFTAPSFSKLPITSYTVTASPGGATSTGVGNAYAGGGGGGAYQNGDILAAGGGGGAGRGGNTTQSDGVAGTANTGSGGGGGGSNNGAAGGSGLVIVRYLKTAV